MIVLMCMTFPPIVCLIVLQATKLPVKKPKVTECLLQPRKLLTRQSSKIQSFHYSIEQIGNGLGVGIPISFFEPEVTTPKMKTFATQNYDSNYWDGERSQFRSHLPNEPAGNYVKMMTSGK